jgi:ubiquinol-cytochrome c reductase cytochrome c1 subunit
MFTDRQGRRHHEGVVGPEAGQGVVRRRAARPDLDRPLSLGGGQGPGVDYLYTFMRTYYRDDTKATGWNNLAFPNVGMPHVLWELQGVRIAKFETGPIRMTQPRRSRCSSWFRHASARSAEQPPAMTSEIADLVAFLQWMGEPARSQRVRIGVCRDDLPRHLHDHCVASEPAFWKDIK